MPKRKNPSEARLYSVRVAVRESDLTEFRNEAYQRQISVSALLFKRLVSARPVAAVDSRTAAMLGKAGAVINQLARKANVGLVVGITPEDLKDLYDVIRTLRHILLGGAP